MSFSREFRENIVEKVMGGSSIQEVSESTGVSKWSVYQWVKSHRKGQPLQEGPRGLTLQEKGVLLFDSQRIAENDMGEWLRKNGICSDHLIKWRKELDNAMVKSNDDKAEVKRLRQENEELKKDLRTKEKALAEVTALFALKKKLSHLFGDEAK